MDIVVRGAREHNLTGIDLDLPRGAWIAFTGPSGSGKTSLAFDTLHNEGQRRYLEALSPQVRRFAGKARRPAVDVVLGLPPTIALEQIGPSASGRSSVASLADVLSILRVVYGRAGVQHCPTCDAVIAPKTHDQIVGTLLSWPAGSRLTLEAPLIIGDNPKGTVESIVRAGFSRLRVDGEIVRVEDAKVHAGSRVSVVVDRLKLEVDRKDRLYDALRTASRAGKGVVVAVGDEQTATFTDRPYCLACDRVLPPLEPGLMSWHGAGRCPICVGSGEVEGEVCKTCNGSRLCPEARAVRWRDVTLPELLARPIGELAPWFNGAVDDVVSAVPLAELRRRFSVLVDLGLQAIPLNRRATALASGELQRLRLARQVGAGLSGVLYVLDEPSAGLHADDVHRVVALLRALRDAGNTLVVVDHDPVVVAAADRIVDFGPGPGIRGGRIVYQGDFAGLIASDTATGRWFSGREQLSASTRSLSTFAKIGLGNRPLVELPLGGVVAVTGASGSGKTTLLDSVRQWLKARIDGTGGVPEGRFDGLEGITRVLEVDRTPLGKGARSTPATYTGLWDVLRELLAATAEAKIRGLEASVFSLAQRGGRCEACQGHGSLRVDLGPLPDVYVPCEVCRGRRFSADILEVTWKGYAADQLLDCTVDEAYALLAGHPKLEEILRALIATGLGYVRLGQASNALSGGEAQRLRLARELARGGRGGMAGTLWLVDDPTVGLHPSDVAGILGLFRRLADEGATVWAATHHAGFAKAADREVALPWG